MVVSQAPPTIQTPRPRGHQDTPFTVDCTEPYQMISLFFLMSFDQQWASWHWRSNSHHWDSELTPHWGKCGWFAPLRDIVCKFEQAEIHGLTFDSHFEEFFQQSQGLDKKFLLRFRLWSTKVQLPWTSTSLWSHFEMAQLIPCFETALVFTHPQGLSAPASAGHISSHCA